MKSYLSELFVKKNYFTQKLVLKTILKNLHPNTLISSKAIFQKSYSTQKLFSKSNFQISYSPEAESKQALSLTEKTVN